MADYQIAIPSYHRHERIGTATLPLLVGAGVDMSRVTVFLTDDDERARYDGVLRESGVHAVVGHGVGTAAAHNHIAESYPAGTPLVQIDDDVTRFVRRVDAKTLTDVTDLPAVIEEGFTAADGTLWGVYPVANPYFMKPRVRRSGLWFIYGAFFGFVVSGGTHERCRIDHGDDYERSIKFFEAHGAVTRLEHYAFISRMWDNPGGLQDIRTPDNITSGLKAITEQWPHLTTYRIDAKGRPNLRLKTPKADPTFVRPARRVVN